MKILDVGAGELAQWFRAFLAIAKDPGSVPSTTQWLTSPLTPIPSKFIPSSGLHGLLYTHGADELKEVSTCAPNINKNK